MRRQLAALAWKEWREQRPIVLAGLALALAMPFFLMAGTAARGRPLDLNSAASAMPVMMVVLLWPLFACVAGAATIANEIGDGTLDFLLSRPASRARIWWVKVGVAAASVLVTVAGSLVISRGFDLAAGGQRLSDTMEAALNRSFQGSVMLAPVAGSMGLLFASSVLFSSFLSRPLTAAAAGAAASVSVIAAIFLIWSRLELEPQLDPEWLAAEIAVAAAIVLVASFFVFSRPEVVRRRGVGQGLVLATLMTMGSGTLAVIPFVYQKARLSPRSAVLSTAMLTPRGEALVATATTAELTSPQVWLIPTDGTGMTRLTGRLTMLLGLSPDGKWAAYLSQRGPLGLRSDQADLRAVRLDGSEDRLIATSVTEGLPQPHAASFSFSPDGSRVALSDGTKLLVATFDGSLPRILEPVSTTVSGYRVAGWNSEGSEILLMSPPWLADEGRDILGFDPGTRQLRTIHTADGLYMYEAGWSRQPEGIRRHLMMVKAEHSARDGLSLMLMDVASGETEEIAQPACYGGVALSEDERLLAYAVCRGDKNAGYTSEVRLWDEAAAGSDHILAVLPDKVTMLSLSPQGDQVLVGRHDTAGDPLPSVILTRTGSVRDLDPGWIPVGWSGRNRVVLADGYAAQRLALADPDTGIRIIYP